MLTEILTPIAGLGFFLSGLHLLSHAVSSIAEKQVRQILLGVSKFPLAGMLSGVLLGAMTQSSNAATFICIGLLQAQLLSFQLVLSISAWAGAGTSLLVFLASVNLYLAALLLVSVVAFFYFVSLHQDQTGRKLTDLLLALGLTFLGLAMIKDTGHSLEQNEWIREFFLFCAESPIYSFIFGFLLALVLQSSSTVSILVVAMVAINLISIFDATIALCGANMGSGMGTVIATSHLAGLPRQLALWQSLVKGVGSLSLLLMAGFMHGLDMEPEAALGKIGAPLSIALIFLLLNVLGAALSAVFVAPILRFIHYLAPLDPSHTTITAKYLIDDVADNAETAILLARREQKHLLSHLSAFLAPFLDRELDQFTVKYNDNLEKNLSALSERISSFLSETLAHPSANDFVEDLLELQRMNRHCLELVRSLHDLMAEYLRLENLSPSEFTMSASMAETLRFLLDELNNSLASDEVEDSEMERLTQNRGEMMTRYRLQIMGQLSDSQINRQGLYLATSVFERSVWLIRQIFTDQIRATNQ